ncbi:MAG: penicillin-binding protein 2, partial [Nitrosospira sp.]
MTSKHAPRIILPAGRSRLLAACLLLGLMGLAGRAAYLQGMHNGFLQQKGESRYSRILEMSADRGVITDRHGEPLAISTPVESVWSSPQDMNATPEQLKKLASLIEMDTEEIRKRLDEPHRGPRRDFVYLKRHLSPEVAARVVELNLPGVFLKREYRRYYPAGELTAHMLGFTDIDDKGQEGIELAWQDELAGKPGSRRVIKDRKGRVVEDVESIRAPRSGQNIALSIDSKIQYLAFRELKQAVEANKAKAG